MVAQSGETIRVCFIDVDGGLAPMVESLRGLSGPLKLTHVESVAAAGAAAETTTFDCFVVRGAMAIDDVTPADGIGTVREARDVLPDVPAAIYSVNLEHSRLRAAFDADIAIVSDAPQNPELVYRQLRYAAGEDRHVQSPSELLESLFEYYPHHLFLKDEVGRFEALSDATAREYDLAPEVIVDLTDFDLLEYETAAEAYREEQELLETGERIVERIDHWVDESGKDRWMSITKAPRYDAEGTPVGIVGSTREVTAEKRKEQMVRELHTVSRQLVRAQSREEIGQAVMAVADDIPVFSHIQAVLADDDGTLDPVDTGDGETLFDRHTDQFRTVVESHNPQYVTADGDVVDDPSATDDLETAVLPLGDHGALGVAADDGTFTEFGIDLTNILAANLEAALDRTKRERELERQNERLEEFASIVSHDLRNPLNVASGAAELLTEETDSPQVDRIVRALDRMEQLIEALLTLARKGRVVGETESVSLAAAARDAWRVVDAPSASLTVTAEERVVVADRNRLVELFENLFRNAIEHGGEGVAVEVGVRADGDGFYVADDGSGIDPEVRGQLFEMGYSGADGTGYGLYIVSTIVDAHGWTIAAGDSDTGGARFDVTDVSVDRHDRE